MTVRAADSVAPGSDLMPPIQKAFETIGFAKTSTSGPDAAGWATCGPRTASR
jgi:hypothetical protein